MLVRIFINTIIKKLNIDKHLYIRNLFLRNKSKTEKHFINKIEENLGIRFSIITFVINTIKF